MGTLGLVIKVKGNDVLVLSDKMLGKVNTLALALELLFDYHVIK